MKQYKRHISSRFISKNTHILLTNHSKASSSPLTLSHPPAICLHHQLCVFIVCVHLFFFCFCFCVSECERCTLLFWNKVLALSYENFLKGHCCPCLNSLIKGLLITDIIDFPFTFLPRRNETEQSCCCSLVGRGFGDRCTQQSKVLQGHSQP